MADLKVVNIDLTGGVVTDAEAPDIGTQIADSENLVKPVGGSPHGLRVRPGVSYFDRIASANPATEGIAPFVCTLDPEDGFPGGSYVTALVDRTTGEILEMSWGIETRGEPAPDETYAPEPDWVPVGICWAGETIPYVPDDEETDINCLITYSPSAGTFRYFVIESWDPILAGGYIERISESRVLALLSNVNYQYYEAYSWESIRDGAGSYSGLTSVDDIVPVSRLAAMVQMGDKLGTPADGAGAYGAGSGAQWVSRGGVLYSFYDGTSFMEWQAGKLAFSRTNAATGANLGDAKITLPLPSGSTLYETEPLSRPDSEGYVIMPWTSRNGSTYQFFLSKINPATGEVVATLEITAHGAGGWGSAAIDTSQIIPLSTGGYFLSFEAPSAGNRKWFHVDANLTTATQILSGRALAVSSRSYALVNMGGLDDTVYVLDHDIDPGGYPTLIKVTGVSTSPAVVQGVEALPVDRAQGVEFEYNYGFLDPYALGTLCFRMPDDRMMWGMWCIVNLSDGSVVEKLTVADEAGLHEVVPEVPGGALFNTFGQSNVMLNPDPFQILRGIEGYLEEV